MSTMQNITGEILRNIRVSNNLTNAAMAAALGCSGAMVSLWENGKYPISHKFQMKIAEQFDITLDAPATTPSVAVMRTVKKNKVETADLIPVDEIGTPIIFDNMSDAEIAAYIQSFQAKTADDMKNEFSLLFRIVRQHFIQMKTGVSSRFISVIRSGGLAGMAGYLFDVQDYIRLHNFKVAVLRSMV